MKIKEIRLKNFGKYKDSDRPLVFKEGVNVVYGLNEAGKSTLFNGLMTLLYGYKPANREAHPYLGWGENKMEVAGSFEDGDGEFYIERKLMSSVTGKLIRDHQEQKINNKPLDVLQSISRPTYESIYALSLHDVVQMEDKPWSEVEDRLILNYGMESVLSPREVLQVLDQDMKKIFNPRAQAKNARVKVLEKVIKDLKKERTSILDNQEAVRDKEETLKAHIEERDGLLKQEALLSKDIQWWEKHEKVIDLTKGIEALSIVKKELQGQIGQIPEAARGIQELGQALEKHQMGLDKLKREKETYDKALKPLTELETHCLSAEDQIRPLLNRFRKYESNKVLQESKEQVLTDKRKQLEALVSDIMAAPSDQQIRALATTNITSIEGKIETLERLKLEIEKLKEAIYAKQSTPTQFSSALGMGLAILGCLVFAGGLYLNQDIIKYAAVLLIAFGGFKWLSNSRQVDQEDIKVFNNKIEFNEKQSEDQVDGLVREVSQLGILPDQIKMAGQRLVSILKQAKTLAHDLEASILAFGDTMASLEEEGREITSQLVSLGIIAQGADIDDKFIENVLSGAIQKRTYNVEIKSKSDLIDKRIKEGQSQYQALSGQYEVLKSYFLNLGDGDLDAGINKLKTFDKLLEKEALLLDQLDEKDPGRIMREQIHKGSDTELDISKIKIELREISERISDTKVAIRGIETEIKHLLEGVDLFDVESQLSALEEELEEAKIAYDKLLTLRTLVAAYDQSYREEHQPDIHKRTGKYFEQISQGKYNRVYNDELIGKTALVVRQGEEEREVENGLSQGTKDQLYLALRLALADELDKDTTAMPLFLDELFVNWDMPRLEEGLALINTIAEKRQVVVFTCHKWMAEKVTKLCKAHLITLEG
jgi:uncharacterized protein YhaN